MSKVRLADIVDGMEMQSDEMTGYLHRPTGRVITVRDEAFAAAEDDDEDFEDEEELAEAREIVGGGADYLALPDRFEIDEYRMMERFAMNTVDADAQDRLLSALRGRRVFRQFKDEVLQLDLADKWYAYRDQEYERVALDWCEANDIDFDPGGTAAT
ncbi:MAG: UPF0158 family protein [Gemmatimonadota bacterium]|nr:UPF0158 family protein [Gemmatimonadota bacterium]